MKNVYVYLYNNSVLFEVILFMYFIKSTQNNLFIVAEEKEIITIEGLKVITDYHPDEVNKEDIDVLVITGGEIDNINNKSTLNELITFLNSQNKQIGAICAARDILFDLKLITKEDLVSEDILIQNNIIIGPPYKYVDFAIELGKTMDIYQDEDDYKQTINFFKFFQNV